MLNQSDAAIGEDQYCIRTTILVEPELLSDLRTEQCICINGHAECIKNKIKSMGIER